MGEFELKFLDEEGWDCCGILPGGCHAYAGADTYMGGNGYATRFGHG